MLIVVVNRNSCPAISVTMFHPTQISCGYCCVTCVSVFNLRYPRDFTSTHIPKGNLVHIYKCVFFTLPHFFLFRPRAFPRDLGYVARREPARTLHARLGPGRGPWHMLWGVKVASSLGEGFRARRASQAPANPRTG